MCHSAPRKYCLEYLNKYIQNGKEIFVYTVNDFDLIKKLVNLSSKALFEYICTNVTQ